jgi:hypothetical protein
VVKRYSYRVLKDHTWIWELVSPEGAIVRHGFAITQAAATANAMSSWLEMMNSQRDVEEHPIGRVRHK